MKVMGTVPGTWQAHTKCEPRISALACSLVYLLSLLRMGHRMVSSLLLQTYEKPCGSPGLARAGDSTLIWKVGADAWARPAGSLPRPCHPRVCSEPSQRVLLGLGWASGSGACPPPAARWHSAVPPRAQPVLPPAHRTEPRPWQVLLSRPPPRDPAPGASPSPTLSTVTWDASLTSRVLMITRQKLSCLLPLPTSALSRSHLSAPGEKLYLRYYLKKRYY